MGSSFLCLLLEGLHGWGIKPEINQTKATHASDRWITFWVHRDIFANQLLPQGNGDPSGCSAHTQCSSIQPVTELVRGTPDGFVAANAWRCPGTWLVMLETCNHTQLGGTETLMLFCPTHLSLQWSPQWERKLKSNDWDLLCVCVFVLTGFNLDDS